MSTHGSIQHAIFQFYTTCMFSRETFLYVLNLHVNCSNIAFIVVFIHVSICDIVMPFPGIVFVCLHVNMHVTLVNIRNMQHAFLRNVHVWGSNIHVACSWLTPVYSRPQTQEHHWHPTVSTPKWGTIGRVQDRASAASRNDVSGEEPSAPNRFY